MMSQLAGVYTAKKKNGTLYYRASLTYRAKHISLGSYENAKDAHNAYLLAGSILNDPETAIAHYRTDSVLPFEKWVCLINFRDNGVYFANPIYIRPAFFYYYLSPSYFFIFDRDDLFYYAHHKISSRGGHYFVADYGMQINIMNRYGIKNYAVLDKDYRFINGNATDFRYENIEILNSYHGVSSFYRKGKLLYKAKIHVKGNYTIGVYDTETEAAIAYNKAIDYLKKGGVRKAYTPNYMENMSPAAYADLYASVQISSKIEHYLSE
ncbi:MAG: hypothetical protein NC314_12535 [Roseburia sp.]|nr:hypothetical protein [Ruminococcus sp.]MCM1155282.1 hypothetical protein [Roseburia sp.]MCM1243662.1 hypothetical protein [Roseburia sp.]